MTLMNTFAFFIHLMMMPPVCAGSCRVKKCCVYQMSQIKYFCTYQTTKRQTTTTIIIRMARESERDRERKTRNKKTYHIFPFRFALMRTKEAKAELSQTHQHLDLCEPPFATRHPLPFMQHSCNGQKLFLY